MSHPNTNMNPSPYGTPTSTQPVRRKRGRPRKDETRIPPQPHSTIFHSPIITTRQQQLERLQQPPAPALPTNPTILSPQPLSAHMPTSIDKGKAPAASSEEVKNGSSMIGKVVTGVIDGSFGDGYLVSVKVVGESDDAASMRGMVFLPGKIVPVTSENDLAPFVKRYTRKDIPIPDITRVLQQNPVSPTPPPMGTSSKSADQVEKSNNEESASVVVGPDGDQKDKIGEAVTVSAVEVTPTAEKTSTDHDHQTASEKAAEDVTNQKQDGASKESETVKEAAVDVVMVDKETVQLPVLASEQTLDNSGKQSTDPVVLGNENNSGVLKGGPGNNIPTEEKGAGTDTAAGDAALKQGNEAVDKTEEEQVRKDETEKQLLAPPSETLTLVEQDGSKNHDAEATEPPKKALKTSGDSDPRSPNGISNKPATPDAAEKTIVSDPMVVEEPVVEAVPPQADKKLESDAVTAPEVVKNLESVVVAPEAGKNSDSVVVAPEHGSDVKTARE